MRMTVEEKNNSTKHNEFNPGDLVMNRTLNVAGDDWETHMCVIVDAHAGMISGQTIYSVRFPNGKVGSTWACDMKLVERGQQ